MITMPRRAGIYARISSDPTGGRLGVTRQEEACRERAALLGWTVVSVFIDNDVSASSRKPRPQYQALLAAIERGTVDAVIVWNLDRLTRRPIEIEDFIDLADRHGTALASVGGDIDLATDGGRLHARIMGAVARAEVERKSARQKAANVQRARSGRTHVGRRAFGYSGDGASIVESEARELRWAAETMLAGGTVRGIVREWAARDVLATSGGPWRPTELRRALANPRYAGLTVYQGEVLGPGSHPAILDADTFTAVKAVLSDPARHKAGRPQRYLLSGHATCAACGGRIFGTAVRERSWSIYQCETRRHVNRKINAVDDFVIKVIARRLAGPDVASLLADDLASSEEIPALRGREAALRARLDGLAEAFAAGDIDRTQLRRGTERLRVELDVVEAGLTAATRHPVLTDLLATDDVEMALRMLDLDRMREALRLLVDIRLHAPGRGSRAFDPSTVEITWRRPRDDDHQ